MKIFYGTTPTLILTCLKECWASEDGILLFTVPFRVLVAASTLLAIRKGILRSHSAPLGALLPKVLCGLIGG